MALGQWSNDQIFNQLDSGLTHHIHRGGTEGLAGVA